jgi:hypothetical protein
MSIVDREIERMAAMKVGDAVHRRSNSPTPTIEWLSGTIIAKFDDPKCGPLIVARWWNPWRQRHIAEMYDVTMFPAVHAGKLRRRSTGCPQCEGT